MILYSLFPWTTRGVMLLANLLTSQIQEILQTKHWNGTQFQSLQIQSNPIPETKRTSGYFSIWESRAESQHCIYYFHIRSSIQRNVSQSEAHFFHFFSGGTYSTGYYSTFRSSHHMLFSMQYIKVHQLKAPWFKVIDSIIQRRNNEVHIEQKCMLMYVYYNWRCTISFAGIFI